MLHTLREIIFHGKNLNLEKKFKFKFKCKSSMYYKHILESTTELPQLIFVQMKLLKLTILEECKKMMDFWT